MNIFMLDYDVNKCAQFHVDKHVVKMILEYAQLLSTAHHMLDGIPEFKCYKPTHKNHPSSLWVREAQENYHYVHNLLKALCVEYTYRYNKIHKTEREGIVNSLKQIPVNLKPKKMTPIKLAMDNEFKLSDGVQSYRNYYKNGKKHLHVWKNRPIPYWMKG